MDNIVCVCLAVVGIVFVSLIGIENHTRRIEIYVENGYTRCTIPGYGEATWCKGN
jgi:uncharacterized protein YsxB (DUF464 family)